MKFSLFNRFLSISLFAGMVLAFQSCSVNPVTGKKQLTLVSEAQELAMGAESDPSIIANYGLYQDEKMQAFINEKGKEMGAISHRPDLEYKFRILDSPILNAFAVPGGYVYFTRGIMAHFNNEAEFAGVLGHEIGHITARHSVSQMSKQQLYGGLFTIGMIASEEFRNFGQQASQGLQLLFLKFGRDDESQSDELGVSYSTAVGYDAHEMANFFGVLKRMQQSSGSSIPTFQSTHPDPGNRFNKVHEHATKAQAETPGKKYKINRDQYLRMIDGIIYGDDPRQGFVEGNKFYHPELKFSFVKPTNWQLINTPSMVQMAPQGGEALMIFTLAREATLDQAAQATIEQDQLQVVESSKVRVNGLPAIAMISEQTTQGQNQQGQQTQQVLRILTYLIEYNGAIYKFHGLTRQADFNKYYQTFNNTMTNFNKLTDPSKLNRQPDRIRVKTVANTSTLQQVLRGFNVTSDKLETTAVLNNMQLSDQVKAGSLIKIISG